MVSRLADVDRSAPHRRVVWSGVAGMLLVFMVLGSLHALTVRPFLPADEIPHTGYAVVVGRGHLPTLSTPTPLLPKMPPRTPKGHAGHIYTANHPPLYYALVAPPLRMGIALGHPLKGVLGARLVTVGLGAAGIAALAALALLLFPKRPRLVIAAAGIGPLLPSFVHLSGQIDNNALGFTTATATLAAAVLALVRGPSRRRLALLAVTAAAAALTRASGIPFAMLAVLAAAGAVMLGSHRPLPARAAVAALHAAVVAAVAGGAAGWFYLRNLALYGDIAGTSANLAAFDMHTRGSPVQYLLSWSFWTRIHDQLWGRFAGMQFLAKGGLALGGRLTALLVITGLLVAAVRRFGEARVSGDPRVAVGGLRSPLLWGWLLALSTLPLMMMALSDYVAAGGGAHARYLYPALAAFSLIAAAGLDGLPGARRGLPAMVVLTGEVILNLVLWMTMASRLTRGHPSLLVAADRSLRAAIGLPAWVVLPVVVLLLGVGLALSCRALWLLGGSPEKPAGSVGREPDEQVAAVPVGWDAA